MIFLVSQYIQGKNYNYSCSLHLWPLLLYLCGNIFLSFIFCAYLLLPSKSQGLLFSSASCKLQCIYDLVCFVVSMPANTVEKTLACSPQPQHYQHFEWDKIFCLTYCIIFSKYPCLYQLDVNSSLSSGYRGDQKFPSVFWG